VHVIQYVIQTYILHSAPFVTHYISYGPEISNQNRAEYQIYTAPNR